MLLLVLLLLLLLLCDACSPSLSSSETFQVDVVEAWQLVPPQEEPASQGNGKKGTCITRNQR
jgi:hypothetical protein